MKKMMAAAVAAALLSAPALVHADTPGPAGSWTAFQGCWRAQGETSGPMVCVLPGDVASTARIVNVDGGVITSETQVQADGTERPVSDGGCTGTERAWFSSDGRRVFTRAELRCDGVTRVSTGVMGVISEVAWVDAQTVTVEGQHASRAVQYRPVPAAEIPSMVAAQIPTGQQLALEAARLNASAPLDIAAVIELSQAVAPPAAEALLAARAHGFGLDGRKLVQLADAGVPSSTIDMVVALSHPRRFAVETRAEPAPMTAFDRDIGLRDSCMDYDISRRYAGGYEECRDARLGMRGFGTYGRYGYGYGSRWGYSPFGYDPYGWNYGGRPVVVIVRPGGDDEVAPRRNGEVVKGRGYTRTGSSSGTATPRTATVRDNTSSGKSSGTSSSGATRSTNSGSSSSSGETRTAKPRGGN